jgi:uncharacterized membrane protein YgcG
MAKMTEMAKMAKMAKNKIFIGLVISLMIAVLYFSVVNSKSDVDQGYSHNSSNPSNYHELGDMDQNLLVPSVHEMATSGQNYSNITHSFSHNPVTDTFGPSHLGNQFLKTPGSRGLFAIDNMATHEIDNEVQLDFANRIRIDGHNPIGHNPIGEGKTSISQSRINRVGNFSGNASGGGGNYQPLDELYGGGGSSGGGGNYQPLDELYGGGGSSGGGGNYQPLDELYGGGGSSGGGGNYQPLDELYGGGGSSGGGGNYQPLDELYGGGGSSGGGGNYQPLDYNFNHTIDEGYGLMK